jgi:hypothetical protein
MNRNDESFREYSGAADSIAADVSRTFESLHSRTTRTYRLGERAIVAVRTALEAASGVPDSSAWRIAYTCLASYLGDVYRRQSSATRSASIDRLRRFLDENIDLVQ